MSRYEAKTKPTEASVESYLAAITDDARRADCEELVRIFRRVTGCEPKMWGTSIVGFDQYHYTYASGHSGTSCILGFSSRKGDLSVYMVAGYEGAEKLLAKLGKHRIGKACLYLKRLADIDLAVLEQLAAKALKETHRQYPSRPA